MWTGSKRGAAIWLALGLVLWTTLALADGLSGGIGTSFGGGISGRAGVGTTATVPGGANTQVQFNSAGAFAGDSGFTYAGAGGAVAITGTLASGALTASAATVTALAGTGSRCVQTSATGVLSATASACGSGGGGTPGGATTQVQFNSAGAFAGDSGFTYAGAGQVTHALGTITTNLKALTITATWNAAGVVFDAPIFASITNTASAAFSKLLDLQVGGSTIFAVGFDGVIRGDNGTHFNNVGSDNVPRVSMVFDGVHVAGQIGWAPGVDSRSGNDTAFFRQAAGIVGLHNTTLTSAAGLQVFNTSDVGGGAPTNFERGVFDWTTTANVLTIGTQKGGTGSVRDVNILSAQNVFVQATGGESQIKRDSNHAAIRVGTNNSDIYFSPDGGGSTVFGLAFAYGNNIALAANYNLVWTSAANLANTSTVDVGLNRAAVKVISFNDGAADVNGWMQWAGQARVTADFSVTSSTVLVNVTGLSVNVQAGRTYQFEAELYVTDAAAGGVQAAIAGTATATAIQYTGFTIADNAIKGKTNATALATAVGSTVTTETAGIIVRITGIITVNAAGTLTVQMAQNTSNATATIAKRGSRFMVYDMP